MLEVQNSPRGYKKALEKSNGEPSLHVQKYVLEQCKKWNLVWVGKNKVALVELNMIEIVMGVSKKPHEGSQKNRNIQNARQHFLGLTQ